MGLNAFDLLLLVFLLIGIVLGAIQGAGRKLVGIISAWLGLIICLWLYIPFSRQILMGLFENSDGGTRNTAVFDTFAFIMLLIVFSGVIQFIIVQTTKSPEEKTDTSGRSFLEKANESSTINTGKLIGGILMGFIVTTVWISVFVAPIRFAIFNLETGNSFILGLRGAMNTSSLLPYLAMVLRWIYASIQLFIPPTGLPAIFSGFLNL
ncbi:MAG: hypothetical protein AAF629_26415 [Chloroflexota bacterium]